MAADQVLLETLPVLALRLERDRLEENLKKRTGGIPYDHESPSQLRRFCGDAWRHVRRHACAGPDAHTAWKSRRLFRPNIRRRNALRTGHRRRLRLDQQDAAASTRPRSTSIPSTTAIRCRARSRSTRNGRVPTRSPPFSGWGTADTEALTGFLAQDKIPDISASYAAALSDPTGAGGKAKARPLQLLLRPELFRRAFAAC